MKKVAITAARVPDAEQLEFMPLMFGNRKFAYGETVLNALASTMTERQYRGGRWIFYRLSNGGCFAAPETPERMTVVVHGNHFEREVSREAAGIIFSLYALGRLANEASEAEDEELLEHHLKRYEELRDFAREHPEAVAIRAAID